MHYINIATRMTASRNQYQKFNDGPAKFQMIEFVILGFENFEIVLRMLCHSAPEADDGPERKRFVVVNQSHCNISNFASAFLFKLSP